MTSTDRKIALLITTGFQPFFEKLNRLENSAAEKNLQLPPDYNEEFADLITRLSKLLIENQSHYLNPWMIDNNAAVQETLLIVQQSLERGSF